MTRTERPVLTIRTRISNAHRLQRARRLEGPAEREHGLVDYIPTEDHISAACDVIQASWTSVERRRRIRGIADRDYSVDDPYSGLPSQANRRTGGCGLTLYEQQQRARSNRRRGIQELSRLWWMEPAKAG